MPDDAETDLRTRPLGARERQDALCPRALYVRRGVRDRVAVSLETTEGVRMVLMLPLRGESERWRFGLTALDREYQAWRKLEDVAQVLPSVTSWIEHAEHPRRPAATAYGVGGGVVICTSREPGFRQEDQCWLWRLAEVEEVMAFATPYTVSFHVTARGRERRACVPHFQSASPLCERGDLRPGARQLRTASPPDWLHAFDGLTRIGWVDPPDVWLGEAPRGIERILVFSTRTEHRFCARWGGRWSCADSVPHAELTARGGHASRGGTLYTIDDGPGRPPLFVLDETAFSGRGDFLAEDTALVVYGFAGERLQSARIPIRIRREHVVGGGADGNVREKVQVEHRSSARSPRCLVIARGTATAQRDSGAGWQDVSPDLRVAPTVWDGHDAAGEPDLPLDWSGHWLLRDDFTFEKVPACPQPAPPSSTP